MTPDPNELARAVACMDRGRLWNCVEDVAASVARDVARYAARDAAEDLYHRAVDLAELCKLLWGLQSPGMVVNTFAPDPEETTP